MIAYSGGVDSTFLLKVAKDILGHRVLAVTATSLTYPAHELGEAKKLARILKVEHIMIKTDEISNHRFTSNADDRCYWCKKELFLKLLSLAKKYKLKYVLDGSNHDDLKDFRPGMKASLQLGVRSPLQEAGFSKAEIRRLSKKFNLPTWDKPSFACLASRFPYQMRITRKNILRVDKAESLLRKLGLRQVRVRHHGTIARIEVEIKQMPKLLEGKLRKQILSRFKKLGYAYISVDLEGYRTGSMNEVLKG